LVGIAQLLENLSASNPSLQFMEKLPARSTDGETDSLALHRSKYLSCLVLSTMT
jgi:hypothetical protein